MLLTKEVKVKLIGKSIKHYKELGYDLPTRKTKNGICVQQGVYLLVKIKDVPPQSHIDVEVACDKCGGLYNIRYDAYNKQKSGQISYDCCINCRSEKIKEVNLINYGVENTFQRLDIKEKIKSINLEKYGVEYPMQNPEVQKKSILNMSLNNGVEASKQQIYINKIFNGRLNYVDDSTEYYTLDIAFPDNGIFVEYDGSGHDLQVKFGNCTESEFKQKEIVRSNILKRNGWKEIRIVSIKDKLPDDETLLSMLDYALNHFNNNHTWIVFDIDNGVCSFNGHTVKYDYGKTKLMKVG